MGVDTALGRAIAMQPEVLERLSGAAFPAEIDALAVCRRVWLVGTGTSAHAAELGADMLALAGLDARWASSARLARGPGQPGPDDGVILLTHTGSTAYARRVRAQARSAGARLVAVTGQGAGWPGAIETVPREQAETYTVSYTAALFVLARLAGRWGAAELSEERLAAVPEAVRRALDATATDVRADRLVVLCGSGPQGVTAREGALKLREAARLPAEGYDAETLLHGAAVPLGPADALVLVQPGADRDGLTGALGEAAAGAGMAVTAVEDPSDLHPLLLQIPLTVRLQRLALELALRGGHDPDTVIVGPWVEDRLWERGAPGG
jgi:glucosamine--fructose-6-phosphate aminotransferase (isomerizing)